MSDATGSDDAGPAPRLHVGPVGAWYGPRLYAFAATIFGVAIVFEAVASSRFPTAELMPSFEVVPPGADAAQIQAFLGWRASTLLLIGVALGALFVSVASVWSAFRVARRPALVLVAAGLALGALAAVVFRSLDEPTSFLAGVCGLLEDRSGLLARRGLADVVVVPKRIAEVIAGFVGVGMASVAVLPGTLDPGELSRRIRRLHLVLYASSAMLVFGVLVTQSSYAFVLSFARVAGGPETANVLAGGGVKIAAAFYTLVLAAGYVPAAWLLSRLGARLAAEAARGDAGTTAEDFLEREKLRVGWRKLATRLVGVLAPLLSGFLAQAAGLLGS